ncbi:MAG: hypothetical protein JXR70_01065 [Spirochaetales bacterium]|nr:hypothetical protein [Spirochaetales bacterium]
MIILPNKGFYFTILVLFFLTVNAFAQFGFDKKTPFCELKVQSEYSVPLEGKALVLVELIVPPNHHVYLDHLGPDAYSILTEFTLIDAKGMVLKNVTLPKGEEYENELILKNNGIFKLLLNIETPRKEGSLEKVDIQLRYQLCDDKSGVCYAPVNLKSEVKLRFSSSSPKLD